MGKGLEHLAHLPEEMIGSAAFAESGQDAFRLSQDAGLLPFFHDGPHDDAFRRCIIGLFVSISLPVFSSIFQIRNLYFPGITRFPAFVIILVCLFFQKRYRKNNIGIIEFFSVKDK